MSASQNSRLKRHLGRNRSTWKTYSRCLPVCYWAILITMFLYIVLPRNISRQTERFTSNQWLLILPVDITIGYSFHQWGSFCHLQYEFQYLFEPLLQAEISADRYQYIFWQSACLSDSKPCQGRGKHGNWPPFPPLNGPFQARQRCTKRCDKIISLPKFSMSCLSTSLKLNAFKIYDNKTISLHM